MKAKLGLLFFFISSIATAEPFRVGVVDTGVEVKHPHIQKTLEIIDEAKQVLTNAPKASLEDMEGHGTHVAGIIVKSLKNTKNVKIVPFKNIEGTYDGTKDQLVKKDMGVPEIVDFSIEHNIKILNFSQTYPFYNEAVFQALKKAKDHGILIVSASGNQAINLSSLEKVYKMKQDNPELADGKPEANAYPCAYKLENIICVGNYMKVGTKNPTRVPVSNFGQNHIDIMAYGENVKSSCLLGSYCELSGSSMSVPRVVGEAVKIWLKNPKLTPEEVKASLIKTLPKDKKLLGLTKNGAVLD